MNERLQSTNGYQYNNQPNGTTKTASDIGPRKTMVVVVIVVGCFAVLWPKVFHPMFFGANSDYMKPNALDRNAGCCDVLADKDISTIKIMSELCSHIVEGESLKNTKQIVSRCKEEVLKTCGIDISAALQENFKLGRSVKEIISQVRSINGSLCLKYNYGVAPWSLGVQHKVFSNFKPTSVRQERPPNLRPEMVHPAFRERGSAIPSSTPSKPGKPAARQVVEGRPGPIPGMRPPMGGAGGVVPPPQKGSSMGIIMPIYTVGIVVFFTYTLIKLLFKKQSDRSQNLYPPVNPDPNFRREIFDSQYLSSMATRENSNNSKIVVNAMSALLDEVDEEIQARKKAALNQAESCANEKLSAGHEDQPKVTVMGMETTASCEGGQKWNKDNLPSHGKRAFTPPLEIPEPPQEIYLEGALPAQSKILVSDAKTEANTEEVEHDPAVVLAGKMTLSVISLLDVGENEYEEVPIKDEEEVESKYTTVSGMTSADAEREELNDGNTNENHHANEDTDEEDLIEDLNDDGRNPDS